MSKEKEIQELEKLLEHFMRNGTPRHVAEIEKKLKELKGE